MTTPRALLLLLALTLGATASGATKTGKTAPLFTSNDILDVTIRAPFTTIMRERRSNQDQPATLTYTDAENAEVSVDLGIRARGRFRRLSTTCKWAPLRLNFKKSSVKKTVFAGSRKMKLVTHCRTGSTAYSQALLSEHLAYRIFNLVTDASFRVRLMRVTYVDTDKKDKEITEFAFLIEHRDQVARRIGLKVNELPSTEVRFLDGPHTSLGSLHQFLIGNTDFSPIRAAPGETCCHNYVLFGKEKGSILAIPYDFDMTGIVNAPHSAPNPNFNLRNVRQRLYRGRCANNEHVATSVQTFVDRKDGIYDLVTSNELYNKKTRTSTLRFIDEFYRIIESPKMIQSQLVKKCVGRD
jgi:hypothetical protein